MDAWTGAAALLAALVLLVVPGLALLSLLRPDAGWVRNAALAPAVSLGTVWTVATALTVLHVPVVPLAVGALLLVVPVGTLLVLRRGRLHDVASRGLRVDRWDVSTLAIAVVVIVGQWWWATRAFSAVPPRDDGTHHGLYTARILITHSVDPAQVLVGDVVTGAPLWSYYPLALHTLAAVIASLGVPVAVAVNAVWVTTTALALPLGMYVLARRTFPSARRAALGAALLVGLIPAVPTGQLAWGGLALAAGLALAPAVADAAIGLLDPERTDRRATVAAGVALGLAVVGMFFTHSTELATVAIVVLCLLLGDRALRPLLRGWRSAWVPVLAAVAVLVLVALPWLSAIRGGASERYLVAASHDMAPDVVLAKLLGYAFGPAPQAWLVAALAVVGVIAAWRRGAAGWLWLAGVVVVLSTAIGMSWPGAALIGTPWYSNLNRSALMLSYSTAALAGYGTWFVARALRDTLRSRAGVRAATAAGGAIVAGVVLALLSVTVPDASTSFSEKDAYGQGHSLATADARASWDWLAAHVQPGERVLNEFSDGSGWMYSVAGVAPVLPQKLEPVQLVGDSARLLMGAAQFTTDPKVRAAARALDVRYAYLGPGRFPGIGTPWLTEEALVAGGWTVVQRTPTTVVLQVPSQD